MPESWAHAGRVRAYVPINAKLPAARLANVLARGKLEALIVDETGVKRLEQLESDLLPQKILGPITTGRKKGGNGNPALQGLKPVPKPVAVNADHCAYVMFPSGTTGLPKGVMVSTGNLRSFLDCMRRLYRLGPEDRVSQFSEVWFDFSVLDLFFAWVQASGGKFDGWYLGFSDKQERIDKGRFKYEAYRVTLSEKPGPRTNLYIFVDGP